MLNHASLTQTDQELDYFDVCSLKRANRGIIWVSPKVEGVALNMELDTGCAEIISFPAPLSCLLITRYHQKLADRAFCYSPICFLRRIRRRPTLGSS